MLVLVPAMVWLFDRSEFKHIRWDLCLLWDIMPIWMIVDYIFFKG